MPLRRTALVAAAIVVLGGIAFVARHDAAERACEEAERDVDELYARGDRIAAIHTIDEVDTSHDCARFTEGDTPPLVAVAQACVRDLVAEGRASEARELLGRARGPILRDLARHGVEPR